MHKQELLRKLKHEKGSTQEMEIQSGNVETLFESAGMPLGKPGPTWS